MGLNVGNIIDEWGGWVYVCTIIGGNHFSKEIIKMARIL